MSEVSEVLTAGAHDEMDRTGKMSVISQVRIVHVVAVIAVLLTVTQLILAATFMFLPSSATASGPAGVPSWWFPGFMVAGMSVAFVPPLAVTLLLLTSKKDWARANHYRVEVPCLAAGCLLWFVALLPNWRIGLVAVAAMLFVWIVWELRYNGLDRSSWYAIREALRGRPAPLSDDADDDRGLEPVTLEEITELALPKPQFGKQGYRHDDVERFLLLVVDRLGGLGDLSASDVHKVKFRRAEPMTRGYHPDVVDELLDRIATTISGLDSRLPRR